LTFNLITDILIFSLVNVTDVTLQQIIKTVDIEHVTFKVFFS